MAEDLPGDVRARKTWLYETQLRRLNLETFRGLTADSTDPRLGLCSEDRLTAAFGGGPSGRLQSAGRVYLDSQQPVWTQDDATRHNAFAASLIGRNGDWLDAREPRRLGEAIAALRAEYDASPFGSVTDTGGGLAGFPRDPVTYPADNPPVPDKIGRAISRAELAAARPWLIPELYADATLDAADPRGWVNSLERYVDELEAELVLATGAVADSRPILDPDHPAAYRAALAALLGATTDPGAGASVRVQLLDLAKAKPEDDHETYSCPLSLATEGAAMGPSAAYPLSSRTRYWSGVIHGPVQECVALKPNSDMGLCHLVRLLYRYGPIPASVSPGAVLGWRDRHEPDETFDRYVDGRAADPAVTGDADLSARLRSARMRLRIVLEETARQPRSPDPSWSPLAGEVLKQGLLSFKFWMDEKPRANGNDRLNQVKTGLGYGDEKDREMEFWSENHYVMFASSEHLLGQLWPDDTFLPGHAFADPGDTTGARPGASRRDRGRARLLKWLNNRLMFGWTEFNSPGYYIEHLWSVLNLADFSLDEEIRTKATMAVDLILFDLARLTHRGSMGAAGGRSQFKFKSHGFDNGPTDVVEILFGSKGVFADQNAEIAATLASSTYTVPEVILQIGAHPPATPYTDRSRVSVTFEEAAKYGVTWSLASQAKDSQMRGYAVKRARWFPHLAAVNREITRTHDDYGSLEDDTVFFWTMSAFFNKQVVRNSLHVIHRFGLEKAEAFGFVRTLVEYVLPILRAPESGLLGFSIASLPGKALGALGIGDDEDQEELNEKTADDLSLVLEGSTRTRVNIVTYRSPGAMLSSLQDFRYGQLNFQSSVQQATLSSAATVFVHAGFAGLDISDLASFAAGAVIGAFVGGPIGAIVGGVGATIANEEFINGMNPLNPGHDDGPDWWTGNWANPRVVQHGGAVIMASEFYDIQDFLAETGSHAWFPQAGFDRVVERRTSAYDDANFALADIGHIGPKGFWLFGKVVLPRPVGTTDPGEPPDPSEPPEPPEEGYVGVFSNKRPQWLTKDDDPYENRLDEQGDDGVWGQPYADLFIDKDWYVNGKNVWIVQVGSRSEFGSFDDFMDRVSSARVHLDDDGDLECTYDIPLPGGGSDRLRLANSDDGAEFELNGGPIQTDLFPRFEGPFVRSGVVEWGQRAYCLEWNGASLLHDFRDFSRPVRTEAPRAAVGDSETILALVLHLRTEGEAMEAFTVAMGAVDVGCERLTDAQAVAVGPVGEDTDHDAEWVFLDRPVRRSPDMTLTISLPTGGGDPFTVHPPFPGEFSIGDLPGPGDLLDPVGLLGNLGGAGDPSWQASYRLRALMGDWTVRDCSTPFASVDVDGDRRDTGPQPFAVRLGTWADWQVIPGGLTIRDWRLGAKPPATSLWLDHHDLVVVDPERGLWHRRTTCAATLGSWVPVDDAGSTVGPDWSGPVSWTAVSDAAGRAVVFAVSGGRLLARVSDASGVWTEPWADLQPQTPGVVFPDDVPIGPGSTVTAVPSVASLFGCADLYLTGSDGDVYFLVGWSPGQSALWTRIETPELDLVPSRPLDVADGYLVTGSLSGELWLRHRDWKVLFGGGWVALGAPGPVSRWAVGGGGDTVLVAAADPTGRVSIATWPGTGPLAWTPIGSDDGWHPRPGADLGWVTVEGDAAWLSTCGVDGTVRTASAADPVWRPVGGAGVAFPGGAVRVATTSRVPGQVELFADTTDGHLAWTWWS